MDESLVVAIAVGLAIGGFLYAGVVKRIDDSGVRKALAVASFALGGGIALWLHRRDWVLEDVMRQLTGRGVALLIVVIGAAIVTWRIRAVRR